MAISVWEMRLMRHFKVATMAAPGLQGNRRPRLFPKLF
jgi:hypothetical protein